MNNEHDEELEQTSEPFVSHLIELRARLLWSLGCVFVIFLCLVPYAKELYSWFAQPVISSLPAGGTMSSIEPHGTFFTPFKFAFFAAFAIAMPIVLYQIWAFIAPGLYKKEKRIVLPLIISTTVLFYCGVMFAYYVAFPVMFKFFIGVTPEGVTAMPDIGTYMRFALKIFIAFGLAFEVPVATVLLARMGIVSTENMTKQRLFVYLGAFVVGMLMTPPDIFSQIFLAVPVCILFELGLFMAKKMEKIKQAEADSLTE